ncbi:MAG: DNA starvation/stationary phase protection protein [Dermabacter sp.]|nr:DNA starvation/stationary phase protection protein [Dermabacter sp.]
MTATETTDIKAVAADRTFEPAPRLGENLQKILVDLTALSLIGKQAHWNIVGPNFRDLHLNLDEVVDIAREGSDEIAERMRAFFIPADGRPATVAETTTLPDFPAGEILTTHAVDFIVAAIQATVHTIRSVRDEVEEDDAATADILHEYILKLEQQAWFVGSENRAPKA